MFFFFVSPALMIMQVWSGMQSSPQWTKPGWAFLTDGFLTCHEAHRPLLRDIGFKAAVTILACFLEGITIHSHKAALCPFSFHKALVQLYTLWDLIVSWVNSKTWSADHVQHRTSYCGKLITLCTHKENTKRLSKYSMRHEMQSTVLRFHSIR